MNTENDTRGAEAMDDAAGMYEVTYCSYFGLIRVTTYATSPQRAIARVSRVSDIRKWRTAWKLAYCGCPKPTAQLTQAAHLIMTTK